MSESQRPEGEPVSNPYKFDAEIAWLRDAARYFAKRPTGGEDGAHWANVYNAENANRLADRLAATQQSPISGEGGGVPEGMMTLADELEDKADELDMMDARGQVWGLEDVSDLMRRARAVIVSAPPVPSVSGGEDQGSSLRDTQPGSADGGSSNEGAA